MGYLVQNTPDSGQTYVTTMLEYNAGIICSEVTVFPNFICVVASLYPQARNFVYDFISFERLTCKLWTPLGLTQLFF